MSLMEAEPMLTEMELNTRVIPHQLCSYCAAFVPQSHYLRKPREELETIHRVWEDKKPPRNARGPMLEQRSTWPSLRYIMESGARGCHLCATMSITIDNDPALNPEKEDKNRPVHASLVLDYVYPPKQVRFWLYLHWQGDLPSDPTPNDDQSGLLIRRMDNDLMIGCDDCANCMISEYSDPESSSEYESNFGTNGESAPKKRPHGRDSQVIAVELRSLSMDDSYRCQSQLPTNSCMAC